MRRKNWFERLSDAVADMEAHNLDRAADQQARRAARMATKVGRGHRRAAKAAQRSAALRDQAEDRLPR
jgi:hypothetical protein